LGERKLSDREILELFDILNENEVFYLTKVICKNKSKDSMIIYKGSLRGGQARRFDKSLLLVGSLNKGAKIVVNGDLYVLGKIRGDIELKDKRCKVYCESINNCLIKIGDVYKLYSEELVSKEIYLEQGKILERDYVKGEINNVKSNSCYIG
jgi:septum formation inhibitor MinC